MLEPLAPVQEKSFRKSEQWDFEREFWKIEIDVICDASKKATTTAYTYNYGALNYWKVNFSLPDSIF